MRPLHTALSLAPSASCQLGVPVATLYCSSLLFHVLRQSTRPSSQLDMQLSDECLPTMRKTLDLFPGTMVM